MVPSGFRRTVPPRFAPRRGSTRDWPRSRPASPAGP